MNRGSLSFLQALKVSRPLWWVTTSVPFIVGSLLADQKLSFTLYVGALYFLVPYNLLVYGVNDIFDYESDIRNPRKVNAAHGSVLAKIKQASLWRWILFINAPFLLFLLLAGNIESNTFLLMMIYMAFAYSVAGLRYKEMPFVDSLTSAFHYTSPFLFGLFLFNSPNLWASAYASFYFWAVGNHAFGAIQDIIPDREAGIKSIATRLGAGKTILFAILSYGLAILAAILGFGTYGLVAAIAIAPFLIIILSTIRHRVNPSAPQFRRAWSLFVIFNYIVGAAGSGILIYLYNK